MAQYKTYSALVSAMNKNINIAVEKTAQEVKEMLHTCIKEQYYEDPGFYPHVYQRTETFLSSVAYQMLSSNSAEIYVDGDGMHYKNGFDSWQVVSWASESKHGADYYQTGTEDFRTRFIDWCNENLLDILKKNLRLYGIQTK